MQQHFDFQPEGDVTVLVAFQGWNDIAGSAASAIDHLVETSRARLWAEVDPEDYYDFMVNQPVIERQDGERRIVWRTTGIYASDLPGVGPVLLVRGIEPSFRWKSFLAEVLGQLKSVSCARVVVLGCVPGETPHTRALPVNATSPQPVVRARYGAAAPSFEGPTGIIGVFIDALGRTAIDCVALWAVSPQYAVGGPASPKVALALVQAAGQILNAPLPLGDLEEDSRAWERGVADLVASDPEASAYVTALEEQMDVAALPEASGDAIAEQFEQFLRRRDDPNL